MAIYSSQLSALSTTSPGKGEPDTLQRRKLTSCFFTNNEEIEGIYNGTHNLLTAHKNEDLSISQTYNKIEGPEGFSLVPETITITTSTQYVTTYEGEYVKQIQKALRVIIESVGDPSSFNTLYAHNIINGNFSGQYDGNTREVILDMQAWAGFDPADIDGIFGPQTLEAMDKLLAEIKYYDCETGEILHNASICVDEVTITRVYQDAIVYRKPDDASEQMANLTALVSKVHIIQDIDNYITGWYYVQFDPGTSGTSGTTYSKNRAFGYIKANKILSKKSMPDSEAKLYLVPSGGGVGVDDTLYEIIRTQYYHSVGAEHENDFGYVLRTSPDSWWIPWNTKEYNMFRFYVNLLLYVNNPTTINGVDKAIYLDYPGASGITPSDILDHFESINPHDTTQLNPDDPAYDSQNHLTNYDYYLEALGAQFGQYQWDWENGTSVVIKSNFHVWLPSKDFADRLYSYINNHESQLAQYQNDIRNQVLSKWNRGFGVELEGSIGVTFGIPIRVEAGGAITLYRKYTADPNEVVMVLKKYGRLQIGIDVGVGAGAYVGNGNKNKAGTTIGAAIRAQAGVHGEVECFTEYEFPLYDPTTTAAIGRRDLSSIALFTSLVGTVSASAEFAAVEFAKAFTDYNIDPMNYLTRMEFRLVGGAEASVGAIAGFRWGNTQDDTYWTETIDSGTPTPDPTHTDPPWHVGKLLSLLNVSAGINAGVDIAIGYEYKATYDDLCFDKKTGARVPKTMTHALITSLQMFINANLSAIVYSSTPIDSSPFIELRLEQEYVRPAITPADVIGVTFTPQTANFTYGVIPRVRIAAGGGNWDFYENSASEFGISLTSGAAYSNTPANVSGALANIEYIYIKKRFKLLSFEQRGLRDLSALQGKMKNFFHKSHFKKFGFGAGAFIDIEGRINAAGLSVILVTAESLLTEIRKEIAFVQGTTESTISWLQVITEMPLYISSFKGKRAGPLLKQLWDDILAAFEIRNFTFHGEMAFGGGAGFQLAAGFKAAIDIQLILRITYDQAFIEDGVLNLPPLTDANARAIVEELDGYLDIEALKNALLKFSGDQVNIY